MILSTLINKISPKKVIGNTELKIENLSFNSQDSAENGMFFAFKGRHFNGHDYLEEAIANGAVVCVVENFPKDEIKGVTFIVVDSTRLVFAKVCHIWFGKPSEHLALLGVTGTNGKTTVTSLIYAILKNTWGFKVGLIGTIKNNNGKADRSASLTTPEPKQLNELLDSMIQEGCQFATMEVSSIGIDQARMENLKMAVAIFTNLTQDHLDYHGSMENYFQAKLKWFKDLVRYSPDTKSAINQDDDYGRKLIEEISGKLQATSYGIISKADFQAVEIDCRVKGTQFHLRTKDKKYLVKTPLIGRLNVYNTLAVIVALRLLKMPMRMILEGLLRIPQVPGRLEYIGQFQKARIFIDYAHTPEGLKQVCLALKELNIRKLIVVFGCGGDRDVKKRPLLGKIVSQYGDIIVLTSDNSRSEKVEEIIEGIQSGIPEKTVYIVETDRGRAIQIAMEGAKEGDVVLVAGRGHEMFQEVDGRRYRFNDKQVAMEIMSNRLRG